MKALIIALTIIMLLGLWEYDEIRILLLIRKFKGEIDWNGTGEEFGFAVDFPDYSTGYFIMKKGLWYIYYERDQENSIACQCMTKITSGSIAGKLFNRKITGA